MSDDRELAGRLATEAGRLLVSLREESAATGKELGRAGDLAANELLIAALAEHRPDDAVLSEESADDLRRLTARRVWIVDPLDGTREYSVPGRNDWAVHVALWSAEAGLVAGAVALPDLGVTYVDDAARVAPVAGLMEPAVDDRPRVVVSGSRPPWFADAVAEAIGGVVASVGSAGAKTMAVVRGEAQAYVHAGGQYEWDSAAPVAVARAKGLWCSRIDGSPMRYNQRDTYLPDLVICRPEYRDAILEVTGRF